MNRSCLVLATPFLLSAALTAHADDVTVGLGIGSLYNGLGANIGLSSGNTLRYVSAGCVELRYDSEESTGTNDDGDAVRNGGNCGIGLGVLSTNLLFDNGKHGLGLGLSATVNDIAVDLDNRAEYHLHMTYNYFFSANTGEGWNLGLNPRFSVVDDVEALELSLILNVGYQF